MLHAQADVLLLSLGAEGCTGWQRRAGIRLGRQRTAAAHTHKLSDEQVATLKANRVLAEARRDYLKAEGKQAESEDQETATDDSHMSSAEDHMMQEESCLHEIEERELEDPHGHLQHNLDADIRVTTANVSSG